MSNENFQARKSFARAVKHRGRASDQRRLDSFRTEKNKDSLAKIHAEAAARTGAHLDVDAMLALLNSIHISSTQTEVQVPATTRGVGIMSTIIFEEVQGIAPRAIEYSHATPIEMYRVTLSQVAVQQHMAYITHAPQQDEYIADHQLEYLPTDFVQKVINSNKTFALLGTVPNSFGRLAEDGQVYRTFIPPHPIGVVQSHPVSVTSDAASPEIGRQIILPNPYFVTIQTLRDIVVSLAGNDVPVDVRQYFRQHNPIPEVQWDEFHHILNPDYLCPPDYHQSPVLDADLQHFRHLVTSTTSKLGYTHGDALMNGQASRSMFVTAYHTGGSVNDPPGGCKMRASKPLTEQQILLGSLSLVGEYPPGPYIQGFGFREPYHAYSNYDFNWRALAHQCLVRK